MLPNWVVEEDIDWSLDPRALRDIYKKSNFEFQFYEKIAKSAVKVLSPKFAEPHQVNYDEDTIYKNLIGPLERFVCGLDESATRLEIDQTFQLYQSLNQQSKICRRILKTGDVTFSCHDCGLDGTCVVCIDCFHKSAHKDHNYRMSNSEGGGCCDCGDIEAWKQNYACSDHSSNEPNLSISDFEDKELRSKFAQNDKLSNVQKINRLPKDVSSRYYAICQASLHYAHKLLTWNNFDTIPPCLNVKPDELDAELEQLLSHEETSKQYFTVLFNDEVHTYDHVINTLVKIIKCTQMTASIIASAISREGRSLIIKDNYKTCKQVRDLIAGVRESGALRVEVIHGSVLAHQAFAIKLVEWIRKMSSLCDAFRIITAYTLLGPDDSKIAEDQENLPSVDNHEMTIVERIMLSNTIYWKIARVEWNDLFVTTLLTEYSIKAEYSRLLTRIYPKIIEYFLLDDHDYSVSILTMTTQIYTVPSLICLLIEEENALSVIAKTLVNFFERTQRDNPTISFENRHSFDMQGLKRVFYIIADLRHLVNFVPTNWTDQLRKNVIEAVSVFLCLLKKMQGMNSVRRQLGQHLEYEPDWESGMTIQSQLMGFITRLVTYCSSDEVVLIETLKEAQSQLLENGGYKKISKVLFGHEANCIQYDVSTSPVSVHWPLTRFVAALINELMSRRPIDRVPYDESLIILNGRNGNGKSMIDIMEPSLRTEVMIAQFRSGMWRRNGYSLNYLILHFHGALMRKEMFDRDILVLQESAAVTDPNEFIIHLLNKFHLFFWASCDTIKSLPVNFRNGNEEDMITQTMALAEEFLQLLLTIVNERYRVGVGCIEEEDVIKYEIIQLLCISPSTRSELSQKLCVTDKELDCIKAVANLKRSTEAATGKYELKDEYYDRFNPFFYHYTRGNQSNALDAQLKRKKNLQQKLICCPPAVPVKLTKQFRYLNELLKCDITLIIIGKVLARTFMHLDEDMESSTKFTTSDLQLDQCLHLIGLGLYEQERDLLGFNYLQAAHEKNIFLLLKESYDEAKRNKDLFFWLMQKASKIIESITLRHKDEIDEKLENIFTKIRELFEPVLSECDTSKQENKRISSELAAQRRERIMAMMKAKQNKFLSNPTTIQLVAETETPAAQSQSPQDLRASTSAEEDMNCDSGADLKAIDDGHLCILCRDEQKVAFDQRTMVLLAYIQRSAVLSKNRGQHKIPHYALTPSNQLKYQHSLTHEMYSFTSDNSWSFDATFMPSDLFFGPHISTCGHVMHFDCWQGFFDAILKRETSRPNRNQPHVSFDLEKFEILCPLCECISNATIPLLPNYTRFAQTWPGSPWNTIFNASPQTIEKSSENLSSCLHALRGTVDVIDYHFSARQGKEMSTKIVISHEDKYIRLLQPRAINEVLEELNESEALSLRDFINSMRTDKISSNECNKTLLSSVSTLAERIHIVGLDLDKSITSLNHGRIFMSTSWSISYTIQAFERVSRLKGSPLFKDLESSKNLCLTSLLRFSLSSMMIHQSDMIQSLLVRKLRYLLINDEHLSSSPSCLDIDAFEMFVSLFILLQKLYTHIEHDSSHPASNKSSASSGEDFPLSSSGSSSSSTRKTSEIGDYAWTTRAIDHEYFRNILHLMLIFNMLQVIISIQNELTEIYVDTGSGTEQEVEADHMDDGEAGGSMSSLPIENTSTLSSPPAPKLQQQQQQQPQRSSQDFISLCSFYHEIILASGHPNDRMPVVDGEFTSKLKARLLPFLRSCAILFYHLSQIAPPKTLLEETAFLESQESFHQQAEAMEEFVDAQQNFPEDEGIDLEAANEEYDSICRYLDLPTEFHHLLKSKEVRHLARGWLRHSRILILIKSALKEKFPKQQADTVQKRAVAPSSVLLLQQQQQCSPSGSSMMPALLVDHQSAQTDLLPVKFIRQPHVVNKLVELPYDYSELVDKVSDFTCPSIKNEDARTPTMCLVCGIILCSHSYCCQRDLNELASNYKSILQQQQTRRAVAATAKGADGAARTRALGSVIGHHPMTSNAVTALSYIGSAAALLGSAASGANLTAEPTSSSSSASAAIQQQLVGSCTYHAHECSGGIGLFLRIRNCQILLLSGRSKGCYLPAPYIDDHGETDFGLRRGNPLHFNRQHYNKLQQMWLTHAIPEKISRTLEYSPYLSSINWHLH